MKMNHVILRGVEKTPLRMRGTKATVRTFDSPSSPVAVEVENLSARSVGEFAKKKGVEAIAPVIPMKLIVPVAINSGINPQETDITWGIKAVGADTSPFTGAGVIVAVLDTGIDAAHPAFAGVNLVRKNFTSESDKDQHGHGTHCAGTIFGREIGGTRIGIAPGITTALIGKVLGEGGGGSDVLLTAIEWALQNGAHIISMSLGIDFPGYVAQLVQEGIPIESATSMALQGYGANVLLFERLASLIQARVAFREPCMVVAAAGNESRRGGDPDYEIAVSPPAAAEGIISVGAVGSESEGFTIAPFSNTGARISAPGISVLSAKRGGGLITMSGTSMATPHVAGIAALWAEKLRTSNQFKGKMFTDRLIGSATFAGLKPGFDSEDFGAGIIQAPQTL